MSEIIHISWCRIYKFGSVTFDYHHYCGPTFLRRNTLDCRRYERISKRNWADFSKLDRLPASEKKKYLVA